LDECYIHGINANIGKLSQKKEVINTKDIMGFGYGLSSLGRYKSPPVGGEIDMSSRRIRVFNKEDYGCYRVTEEDRLDNLYPTDSKIPKDRMKDSLLNKMDYDIQRLFTSEQQGLEAYRLRKIIDGQDAMQYLDSKKYVDANEKLNIKKMHDDLIRQKRL